MEAEGELNDQIRAGNGKLEDQEMGGETKMEGRDRDWTGSAWTMDHGRLKTVPLLYKRPHI